MKFLVKFLQLLGLTFLIAFSAVAIVIGIAYFNGATIHLPGVNPSTVDIQLPDKVADLFGVAPATVNGMSVRDYDYASMEKELKVRYAWDFVLENDDMTIIVEDAITPIIESTLGEAYMPENTGKYTIELPAETMARLAKEATDKIAENIASMEKDEEPIVFDEENDEFVFGTKVEAPQVDLDGIKSQILSALSNEEYTKKIEIKYTKEPVVIEANQFELIGEYESKAVVNSNRNANITLACETVNGMILEPDEEFSYNKVLGKRTPDKGYKQAGVYLNGEHTTDYGGGICQLSSTLYNAIFAANLEIINRVGHTFEPTYVRPGLDATVSYPEPEFIFKNNTEYPVGIWCHFEEQVVTVKVYGVRTLDEGVKRYMRSVRTGDVPAPAIIYQDNPALAFGEEVVVRNGYGGSKWDTYEVLEKDGEVISDEYIYTTKYKGEAPIVQRNFVFYQ